MPALNFQQRFAAAFESGAKRQTIRALRKDGRDPKVGDVLYLYTGMRTKACRKLGEATCTSVQSVWIGGWVCIGHDDSGGTGWCNNGQPARAKRDEIAKADGFEDEAAMLHWFEKTHGLPFTGQLYRWETE